MTFMTCGMTTVMVKMTHVDMTHGRLALLSIIARGHMTLCYMLSTIYTHSLLSFFLFLVQQYYLQY